MWALLDLPIVETLIKNKHFLRNPDRHNILAIFNCVGVLKIVWQDVSTQDAYRWYNISTQPHMHNWRIKPQRIWALFTLRRIAFSPWAVQGKCSRPTPAQLRVQVHELGNVRLQIPIAAISHDKLRLGTSQTFSALRRMRYHIRS